MVAITVVLAAVLYTWALQFIEKEAPECSFSVYLNEEGDSVIELKESSRKWSPNEAYLVLKDRNGQVVEEHEVQDVYMRDLDYPDTNITLDDSHWDSILERYDRFIIRSEDNGGPGRENMVFSLYFSENEELMGKVTLPGRPGTRQLNVPFTVTQFFEHDKENLSVNHNQSLASHVETFRGNEIRLGFDFQYTGQGARELILELNQSGENLRTDRVTLQPGESYRYQLDYIHQVPGDGDKDFWYTMVVRDAGTEDTLIRCAVDVMAARDSSDSVPSFASLSSGILILSSLLVTGPAAGISRFKKMNF